MVKAVQIDIGEKLTGQVADRDAAPPLKGREKIVSLIVSRNFFLRIAGINDEFYQPKSVPTFNFSGNTFQEDFVVDRGEIFADVRFQNKAIPAGKFREAIHSAVRTFTRTAGVGIVDERSLNNRFNNTAQGMMDNPIAIGSSADTPGLAFVDRKFPVATRLISFLTQFLVQGDQFIFNVHLEGGTALLGFLAHSGRLACPVEVFKRDDFFVESTITFHDILITFSMALRTFRLGYQARNASLIFVRIAPAQEADSIDDILHYPGFLKTPASWHAAIVLGGKTNTKPVVVVPVVRIVPVPVRRAGVLGIIVPATAAQHVRPAP